MDLDIDQRPVPNPGLRQSPGGVPWYMHKRTQGAMTTMLAAVLQVANVTPAWANVIMLGAGVVLGVVGHVDAEERKVTVERAKAAALVTTANKPGGQ